MQDIASERAILSCMFQYGANGFSEVSDIINEECFDDNNNKILYKILIKSLDFQDKIDLSAIISTANELNLKNFIEKDENIRYIRSLSVFPIKLDNIRPYAKKLKKLSIARNAQIKHKVAFDELAEITGKETIDQILSISEKPINEIYDELNDKQDGP